MTPTSRTLAALASLAPLLACEQSPIGALRRTSSRAPPRISPRGPSRKPRLDHQHDVQRAGPTLSNDELSSTSDLTAGGIGGFDIWVSQRACKDCRGSSLNLGPAVNTTSDETGPGLSIDGHLLFFRSTRPGGAGLGTSSSQSAPTRRTTSAGVSLLLSVRTSTPRRPSGGGFLQSAEDGASTSTSSRAPGGPQIFTLLRSRGTVKRVDPPCSFPSSATDRHRSRSTLRSDGRKCSSLNPVGWHRRAIFGRPPTQRS